MKSRNLPISLNDPPFTGTVFVEGNLRTSGSTCPAQRFQGTLKVFSISAIFLSVIGITLFLVLPSVFSAEPVYPEIYSADSNRDIVNFGLQPESSPLILSVKIGVGGNIDRISIDLEGLSGARCYHPGSDSMVYADFTTPMKRVYRIDGQEAYLISSDDEYEDNRYITAVTHQTVEGWAERTNKWQVELFDTGYRTGIYRLRVQAVNQLNHASTAIIPLQITQDLNGPVITLETKTSNDADLVACPGEMLTIQATVIDDLSGTFSVKMVEGSLPALFGEEYQSELSRQINTETWSVRNHIPYGTEPGYYMIEVSSVDYAGNSSINNIWIEVIPHRSSFQLELEEGWNLVSVPTALTNPAVESVFSATPIASVQTVVESQRIEPDQIEAGRGYLVKSIEPLTLTVDLDTYDPSAMPPVIKLTPGWNLIGYASPRLDPAMPLTYYLGADLKGKWIVIFTEDGAQARAKTTSPYVWAVNSFPTTRNYPFSGYSQELPVVELGKGYWIYMIDEGVLIP